MSVLSRLVDFVDSLESFLYFWVCNITIALAEIRRKFLLLLMVFKYWWDLAVVFDVVLFLLFHRPLRSALLKLEHLIVNLVEITSHLGAIPLNLRRFAAFHS